MRGRDARRILVDAETSGRNRTVMGSHKCLTETFGCTHRSSTLLSDDLKGGLRSFFSPESNPRNMDIEAAFGTSLIGTWLTAVLFGLTIPQAFHYFNDFPNDSLLRKSLVASCLLFCFVGLIGECAFVYLPLVTFWGNPAAVMTATTLSWAVFLYPISHSLVGITVHSYLISRFYILSKNLAMAIVLFGMTLLVFAMALMTIVQYSRGENFQRAETNVILCSVSLAAADFCIAASLIWTLRRMSSLLAVKSANRLVRPIIMTSIRNGCVTSLVALGGMVAVLIRVGNVYPIFYFSLAPFYVLTLLSNLNLRQSGRSPTSGMSLSTTRNVSTMDPSVVIAGVRVAPTATTLSFEEDTEMGSRQTAKESTVSHSRPNARTESFNVENITFRSSSWV
ncbi:hypothetical protein DFH06DRAFT_1226176 [Mycena polygramma]|nr:hypothetical protein DFH06DRAFT_1226176 [Mycena polygramma]